LQVAGCWFKVGGNRRINFELGTWNLELGTWNPLRLPAETLDLLNQLGIVRLDQLLALPRESLRSRFGDSLLLRIDQLLGTAAETIVPHRAPPQFAEERLFDYPAERRDIVEHSARELIERIAAALAERREGVVRLVCRLDCAPGRRLLLEVGLFRPSADPEHLWDLVRMQFEQTALPGPVGRLRVEATLTAPLENRQGELFAGGRQEAERQLALLIDRCTSRLGGDTVLRPELTADALPGRAVRFQGSGFGGQGSGIKVQRRRAADKFKVNRLQQSTLNLEPGTWNCVFRPLWLYSPPRLLAVVSIAPAGAPRSFELSGRRQDVVYQWGPERIETGWWRGKSVRRDYWRVQTATGQRFWLFRQLQDGQWYLHGDYG
jgi:protein ImuB